MKRTASLRCFLTHEIVLADRTLSRENDSSGIIDSCPGCSRPHSAHLVAKISKVKRSRTDFIDPCICLL